MEAKAKETEFKFETNKMKYDKAKIILNSTNSKHTYTCRKV